MRELVILISISLFFVCNSIGQTTNPKIFNKSYKKQINSGEINKNEIEHFDERTKIYSNFKYGISYKETRDWEIDYGVGQYTIYRATQKDSAYTFSINVIETTVSPDNYFDIHKMVDEMGIEVYKNQMVKNISKLGNVEVIDMSSQKIYLKNFPAMRNVFLQNMKDGNYEIIFVDIMYQIMRENLAITCTLSAPQIFYDENENSLNQIFENIHLLNIIEP